MRKLFVVAICAYLALVVCHGIAAAQALEYEFTVTEKVGLLNSSTQPTTPAEFSSVVKTFFRRADGIAGSMIRETRRERTATTVLYRSPRDHALISVQVDAGIRSTYAVPAYLAQAWSSVTALSDCSGRNAGYELAGEVVLLGARAQHFRVNNPSEQADIFLAPALGCAEIKAHHLWKDASGTFVSWTEVALVNLSLGPPNPGLFGLEMGAREAPPSDARAAIHAILFPQLPTAACWKRTDARADANYSKAQEAAAKSWPAEKPKNAR